MTYKLLKFPEKSLFLVTGGAGFIGYSLCDSILNLIIVCTIFVI